MARSTLALVRSVGLRKRFGRVEALAGLDVDVPTGIVALLGPNGAGKTTLMRILATLSRPDAGRVWLRGVDVLDEPGRVRHMIGVAGQHVALADAMTGMENLQMISRLRGLGRRAATLEARGIVDRLGLGEVAGRPARTYSGGMRRRLDLGAALVGRPEVLLLDEPTTGLDPESRRGLWDAIRARRSEGTDVLMTTQYLEEADQMADHVVVVDRGKVIAGGSPGELAQRFGEAALHISTVPRDTGRVAQTVEALLVVSDVDVEGGHVVATGRVTADVLARLFHGLVEDGVEVTDVEVRRPTLDEAFLALTTGAPAATGGRR